MSTQSLNATHSPATQFLASQPQRKQRSFVEVVIRTIAVTIRRVIIKGLIRQRIRRTYLELSKLDDRTLRDIGLTRSSLPFILESRANDMIETDRHPFR